MVDMGEIHDGKSFERESTDSALCDDHHDPLGFARAYVGGRS
jgi:hypothetical protein